MALGNFKNLFGRRRDVNRMNPPAAKPRAAAPAPVGADRPNPGANPTPARPRPAPQPRPTPPAPGSPANPRPAQAQTRVAQAPTERDRLAAERRMFQEMGDFSAAKERQGQLDMMDQARTTPASPTPEVARPAPAREPVQANMEQFQRSLEQAQMMGDKSSIERQIMAMRNSGMDRNSIREALRRAGVNFWDFDYAVA